MAEVPRQKTDLEPQDRDLVRAAWETYRARQGEAEKSRKELVRVLRRLQRRYPVAAIARAAKVSPMAVWNKLKKS
jgi:hypothetical protein